MFRNKGIDCFCKKTYCNIQPLALEYFKDSLNVKRLRTFPLGQTTRWDVGFLKNSHRTSESVFRLKTRSSKVHLAASSIVQILHSSRPFRTTQLFCK